jgi:hypothetical protein
VVQQADSQTQDERSTQADGGLSAATHPVGSVRPRQALPRGEEHLGYACGNHRADEEITVDISSAYRYRLQNLLDEHTVCHGTARDIGETLAQLERGRETRSLRDCFDVARR